MVERLKLNKANGANGKGETPKPGKAVSQPVVVSMVARPPRTPSKYRPEYVEMAREACRLGATNNDLGRLFGVHEVTIIAWQNTYPDFEEASRIGKEVADARVERSLYQRACGYWVQGERYHLVDDVRKEFDNEGRLIATITTKRAMYVEVAEYVHSDTTAQIFWLKNRQPDKWRDKQAIEHTGATGEPITETNAKRIFANRIDSIAARFRETEVVINTK